MQESALLIGPPDGTPPLIQACLAEFRLEAVVVDDVAALTWPRDAQGHAVVLCHLPLPDRAVAQLLRPGRGHSLRPPLVLIEGPEDDGRALPADERLSCPVSAGELAVAIARALLRRQAAAPRPGGPAEPGDGELLGSALTALARCLTAKDGLGPEHARTVADLAGRLATHCGLGEDETQVARLAGALHDVGKVGVRQQVLSKRGALSADEWQEIRRHPEAGAEILSRVEPFADLAVYVRHHHERPDGNGYPGGLRNGQIPLVSRLIAVADAFDAMVRPRPYRGARGLAHAAREFRSHAGTQWDSGVVDRLFACVPELSAWDGPPAHPAGVTGRG